MGWYGVVFYEGRAWIVGILEGDGTEYNEVVQMVWHGKVLVVSTRE